ncbi:MAG: hypothetical protein Ta2A_20270 [Treponemataceae bacterium]|nr:MAG: hypothetical protein Ta2A_20270 [Treponemataceae bacterium]
MKQEMVNPFLRAAQAALCGAVTLAFFSCASINPYAEIDPIVHTGDFAKAAGKLEAEKKTLYRDKDAALYCLDYGMLLHLSQDAARSITVLQRGETLIEAAYTKSVSAETASYIANDNSLPYAGEDYENIYVNVFNALNYFRLHAETDYRKALEEALVEIRRANHKMQLLRDRYEKKPNFQSSALSRYLGMLFYRANGNYDDARIDASFLPTDLQKEFSRTANQHTATLNVLAFSGLVPPKEEDVERVWLPNLNGIQIALPRMGETASKITSVEVEVIAADGQRSTHKLFLLEDIAEVARASFALKSDLIYAKSIARATAKAVTAAATEVAAYETEGTTSAVLSAISLFSKIMTFTERADLRLSHYFPARAWAKGIELEAGTYSLNVNYFAHSRILKTEHYSAVTVTANRINLTESFCVK